MRVAIQGTHGSFSEAAGRLQHYSDIDLVVLHGRPLFGDAIDTASVRRSLRRSLLPFLSEFSGFVLQLCSDGLNGRTHMARMAPCGEDRSLAQLRHGVYAPTGTPTAKEASAPYPWTRAVLELGRQWGVGRLHFNNWSPTAASIEQLGLASKAKD
jgi:hypothetical protein